MRRRAFYRFLLIAVLLTIAPCPANAQDRGGRSQALRDHTAQEPLPSLETFGPLNQVTWISALNFTGAPTPAHKLVDFSSPADFYTLTGAPGPALFYTELKLPAGAKLNAVQCAVYDVDLFSDLTFDVYRSHYNHVTNTASYGLVLGQLSSSGSSGFQEPALVVAPAAQLIQYEAGDEWYLYYIQVTLPSIATRFRGCRLSWQRTVSVAPGSATFNDVPIGHAQRQFIEALVASGITGGCGGGNYCPDAPLTRGQMAVFLAAALGLHWPN